MPNDNQNHRASDILKALHEFLLEPDEDMRTKPLDEVRSELKRHGIDVSPLTKQVKERLAKAKAHHELKNARAQREEALARLKSVGRKLANAPSALREKVVSLLGNLSTTDPETATAFFNKFEQATEADLQSLIDDLAFLEEQDDEGDGSRG